MALFEVWGRGERFDGFTAVSRRLVRCFGCHQQVGRRRTTDILVVSRGDERTRRRFVQRSRVTAKCGTHLRFVRTVQNDCRGSVGEIDELVTSGELGRDRTDGSDFTAVLQHAKRGNTRALRQVPVPRKLNEPSRESAPVLPFARGLQKIVECQVTEIVASAGEEATRELLGPHYGVERLPAEFPTQR